LRQAGVSTRYGSTLGPPHLPSLERNVEEPVLVGDTIHVEIEVIETRPASKKGRGLVRTKNQIVNMFISRKPNFL
jgi:Acyl dehydratase